MIEPDIIYPIRINRYLALKQFASRRQADEFIKNNKVTINGKLAKLGELVYAGDKVEIDEVIKEGLGGSRVYFAYYKPKGEDTEQKSINGNKLFPVGRLDKESHGLLILTNDGRITGKLLDPNNRHEKEYVVRVDKNIRQYFLNKMNKGMPLEGKPLIRTLPAKTKKINENTFQIILNEGKHHQIRRMCDALGFAVQDLKRIRIINIALGKLHPGQSRQIQSRELEIFLADLGLD